MTYKRKGLYKIYTLYNLFFSLFFKKNKYKSIFLLYFKKHTDKARTRLFSYYFSQELKVIDYGFSQSF